MSFCRQHCLAVVFVLLAVLGGLVLALLAGGYLRVDNEWPGLVVGALLLLVLVLALCR